MSNEPNSSFSPSLPTLQIAWDSTSLGALKTCPRLYQYSILEGWQPRRISVHLTFGLLYHAALERYDHARALGQDHDGALIAALRYAMTETWDKTLRRPWVSDDKYKNRLTLIRSIIFYLDQFRDDPLVTLILANGKPAVELSFQLDLDWKSYLSDEPFVLCGHLDRIASMNDETYIVDRKTTKSSVTPQFWEKYTPDNQFSTYLLAGKVVFRLPLKGLIVDVAQVQVNNSTFHRGFVTRTDSQLEEWRDDLGWWINQAQSYAAAGYWPQNDKSCDMYGGCPFRSICSKAPSVRRDWLEASFDRRKWDPLQRRGDI